MIDTSTHAFSLLGCTCVLHIGMDAACTPCWILLPTMLLWQRQSIRNSCDVWEKESKVVFPFVFVENFDEIRDSEYSDLFGSVEM